MAEKRNGERDSERASERVRLEDPLAVGADHLIEEFEAEKPARKLSGFPKLLLSVAGVALSCYALYWVLSPVPAQIYRTSFLAVALAMTFILYRAWEAHARAHARPGKKAKGRLIGESAVRTIRALRTISSLLCPWSL